MAIEYFEEKGGFKHTDNDVAGSIKEVLNFMKGGFNINVSVNPNNYTDNNVCNQCGMNPCMCNEYKNCNKCGMNPCMCNDQYYSGGSGEMYYKTDVNTSISNLDEYVSSYMINDGTYDPMYKTDMNVINDGTYDPMYKTDMEMIYGDNMVVGSMSGERVESELEIRAKGVFMDNGIDVNGAGDVDPYMLVDMYVNDENQAISIVKGLYYALHNDDLKLIEDSINAFHEDLSKQMDESRLFWLKKKVTDLVYEIIVVIESSKH
jgi:hypothetical protein